MGRAAPLRAHSTRSPGEARARRGAAVRRAAISPVRPASMTSRQAPARAAARNAPGYSTPRKTIPKATRTWMIAAAIVTTAASTVAIRIRREIYSPRSKQKGRRSVHGGLCTLEYAPASDHDHLRAHLHAAVEIGDVLVAHADAARGHLGADGPWLVRAVDAIERGAEIHRARAGWVLRAADHAARQVGAALEHFGRRRPVRPLGLARDALPARPGKARPPDADAVAARLAAVLDQIEKLVRRIDHDCSGRMAAVIGDRLRQVARIDRGPCGLSLRITEHGTARGERRLGIVAAVHVRIAHIRVSRNGTARTRRLAGVVEQEFEEAAAHLPLRRGRVADIRRRLDLRRVNARRIELGLRGGGSRGEQADDSEGERMAGH